MTEPPPDENRCVAITQKGTRCTRRRKGNPFCNIDHSATEEWCLASGGHHWDLISIYRANYRDIRGEEFYCRDCHLRQDTQPEDANEESLARFAEYWEQRKRADEAERRRISEYLNACKTLQWVETYEAILAPLDGNPWGTNGDLPRWSVHVNGQRIGRITQYQRIVSGGSNFAAYAETLKTNERHSRIGFYPDFQIAIRSLIRHYQDWENNPNEEY